MATIGLQFGYFLARNKNAHLEWALIQAKCLILLVAREGFEPPTGYEPGTPPWFHTFS